MTMTSINRPADYSGFPPADMPSLAPKGPMSFLIHLAAALGLPEFRQVGPRTHLTPLTSPSAETRRNLGFL